MGLNEHEYDRYGFKAHCSNCFLSSDVSAPLKPFRGMEEVSFEFLIERNYCRICGQPMVFDHIFFYGREIAA